MMNSITAHKNSSEYAKGRRIKDNLKMQMEQEKEAALQNKKEGESQPSTPTINSSRKSQKKTTDEN